MKKVAFVFNQLFTNLLGIAVMASVGGGIALTYWFFYMLNNKHPNFWEDPATLGVIGEFLGGTVGSIWALAGVILFFLALIYQKRELVLQREELKESRKIMETQSATIGIQQFENTFFQLLNFHVNASNSIRNTILGTNGSSLNGFDSLFRDFKKEVQSLKKRRKNDSAVVSPDDEAYDLCFRTVYNGYKNTFQHYLENYRTLVVLIQAKSHDPVFYFNILKSHFTEQEVLVQFYYVVLLAKDKNLLKITEQYGLFHKLNLRAVAEVDAYHLEKVNKNAYAHEVA
ncbi:MAG TPA: putative phage abortive infection protein [Fulvivirga sp.]|nr:putative phage abortive infection protein [Fulvivirga sp.]